MVKLSYVLIKANHVAEIPYSLSHRKNNQIIVICPGEKGKSFYEMLNINSNYKNVLPITLEDYKNQSFTEGSIVVLLHPPSTFEDLEEVLKKGQSQNHSVILSLFEQNKKYLNIIGKKINNLQLSETAYSSNKFVGINDKIREFVDQSYDMNRAGFYAYGEFINYYRASLLKKIFRTELINLDDLARSYGFPSAQRVKEGTFLKPAVQQSTKAEKRKRRKQAKKSKAVQQKQNMQDQPEQKQIQKKVKKTKKIEKKTKTIEKTTKVAKRKSKKSVKAE